jgi:Flp pilus assembly pilin Flp
MMKLTMATLRQLSRELVHDQRGAVSTEYVVLVGTMGLALMFALVAVGPKLVKDFETSRTVIAAPVP